MRGAVGVAGLLAASALAGCTTLEELDPLRIACEDARVREAGWCEGGRGAEGTEGTLGSGGPPSSPRIAAGPGRVVWSHEAQGAYERWDFDWESPGRARVAWSAEGSGGISVAVRAGGNVLYRSEPGSSGGGELLAGRPGAWTVDVDLANFAGQARVELASA